MKNLLLVALDLIACPYTIIVCFIASMIAFVLCWVITVYQVITDKDDKEIINKIAVFAATIVNSCRGLHGLISLIEGDKK